jgi:hypothetical protein
MKIRVFVASTIVILFLSGKTFALKQVVQVGPKSQQVTGFSVVAQKRKDGGVRFTITRDLCKAPSFPAGSNLEIRRSGELKVYGDSGLMVECNVAADNENEKAIYGFVIERDLVTGSHFTVAEIDDYKNNEGRERLLGGGTFYEFHLADFWNK